MSNTKTPVKCPRSVKKRGVKESPKKSFNVHPDDDPIAILAMETPRRTSGSGTTRTPGSTRRSQRKPRVSRTPTSTQHKAGAALGLSTSTNNENVLPMATPKSLAAAKPQEATKPDTPVPVALRAALVQRENSAVVSRPPSGVIASAEEKEEEEREELLDHEEDEEEDDDVFCTASEGKSSPSVTFFTPKVIPEVRVTEATPSALYSDADDEDASIDLIELSPPITKPSTVLPCITRMTPIDHSSDSISDETTDELDSTPLPVVPHAQSVSDGLKNEEGKRYEEVEDRLRDAEANYESLLSQLADKDEHHAGEIKDLKAKIANLRAELAAALGSKTRQIQTAVDAAERNWEEKHAVKIAKLHSRIEFLDAKREVAQACRRDLVKQMSKLKRDKAALLNENHQLSDRLDQREAHIDQYLKWSDVMANKALNDSTENEILRAKNERLQRDNEDLAAQVSQRDAVIVDYELQIEGDVLFFEQLTLERERDDLKANQTINRLQKELDSEKEARLKVQAQLVSEEKKRRRTEDDLLRTTYEINMKETEIVFLRSIGQAGEGSAGAKRARHA